MNQIINVPLCEKKTVSQQSDILKEAKKTFLECQSDLDTFAFDPILAASIKNCCEIGLRAVDDKSTNTVVRLIELISFYLDQLWLPPASATSH